jgi:RNA recognition motif-containing protein
VKSLEDFSLQIRKRDNEKGGKAGMNKNLYIGNLSMKVTEEDLKANFSEVGKVVSVNIIKDRYTGISRGFGFVEMETEEAAQEAIRRFSGGQLLGNTITVSEARPKKEGSGGRGGGGFRGSRGGGGGRRY